ncbi:MAG: hypothetical protein AUH68_03690 [Gemmatimonadetes bacterium 13_1_40CM_4_69_5]|nr:MAG: hypothetical protein AUH68_03690 [Gemmatimonadetes bacterium 13_1_40CM_4_69_5]
MRPLRRSPGPAREGDEEVARAGEAVRIEQRRVAGAALETERAQRVSARDQNEPVAHPARRGDGGSATGGGWLAGRVHERRRARPGEHLLLAAHEQSVVAPERERRDPRVPQPRALGRLRVRLRFEGARGSQRGIAERVVPDHDPRPQGR